MPIYHPISGKDIITEIFDAICRPIEFTDPEFKRQIRAFLEFIYHCDPELSGEALYRITDKSKFTNDIDFVIYYDKDSNMYQHFLTDAQNELQRWTIRQVTNIECSEVDIPFVQMVYMFEYEYFTARVQFANEISRSARIATEDVFITNDFYALYRKISKNEIRKVYNQTLLTLHGHIY